MKKNEFKNLLYDLTKEKYNIQLSEVEILNYWAIYQKLNSKRWNDESAKKAYDLTVGTKKDKLKARMCLAERGVELTPDQMDVYVIVLEIILGAHECEEL